MTVPLGATVAANRTIVLNLDIWSNGENYQVKNKVFAEKPFLVPLILLKGSENFTICLGTSR